MSMSRLVGIVALVIAFGWAGFVLWRLSIPGQAQGLPTRPKPIASVESVQRDLCSLAQGEVEFKNLTGRYAEIPELVSERRIPVSDARWPYRYMLYVPPKSDRFLIVAVALTPIESQPRVFQVDDQLQVQSRSHPTQVYACIATSVKKTP
jgi:hypothetical protein